MLVCFNNINRLLCKRVSANSGFKTEATVLDLVNKFKAALAPSVQAIKVETSHKKTPELIQLLRRVQPSMRPILIKTAFEMMSDHHVTLIDETPGLEGYKFDHMGFRLNAMEAEIKREYPTFKELSHLELDLLSECNQVGWRAIKKAKCEEQSLKEITFDACLNERLSNRIDKGKRFKLKTAFALLDNQVSTEEDASQSLNEKLIAIWEGESENLTQRDKSFCVYALFEIDIDKRLEGKTLPIFINYLKESNQFDDWAAEVYAGFFSLPIEDFPNYEASGDCVAQLKDMATVVDEQAFSDSKYPFLKNLIKAIADQDRFKAFGEDDFWEILQTKFKTHQQVALDLISANLNLFSVDKLTAFFKSQPYNLLIQGHVFTNEKVLDKIGVDNWLEIVHPYTNAPDEDPFLLKVLSSFHEQLGVSSPKYADFDLLGRPEVRNRLSGDERIKSLMEAILKKERSPEIPAYYKLSFKQKKFLLQTLDMSNWPQHLDILMEGALDDVITIFKRDVGHKPDTELFNTYCKTLFEDKTANYDLINDFFERVLGYLDNRLKSTPGYAIGSCAERVPDKDRWNAIYKKITDYLEVAPLAGERQFNIASEVASQMTTLKLTTDNAVFDRLKAFQEKEPIDVRNRRIFEKNTGITNTQNPQESVFNSLRKSWRAMAGKVVSNVRSWFAGRTSQPQPHIYEDELDPPAYSPKQAGRLMTSKSKSDSPIEEPLLQQEDLHEKQASRPRVSRLSVFKKFKPITWLKGLFKRKVHSPSVELTHVSKPEEPKPVEPRRQMKLLPGPTRLRQKELAKQEAQLAAAKAASAIPDAGSTPLQATQAEEEAEEAKVLHTPL